MNRRHGKLMSGWLVAVWLLHLVWPLAVNAKEAKFSEHSDRLRNWYLDAAIGWDYANSITLDSNDAEIEFDSGVYDFSGALGRRVVGDWRAELSYASFRNTPEILLSSSAGIELDSDELDALTTKSLTLNVLRDFKIGQAFRPYVGVGVGLSKVDLHFSEASIDGLFIQQPRRDVIDDSDTAFSYQLIAGFSVPVTPWLDLAADYRYLRAPSVSLTEVTGAELNTGHGVQSTWFRVRAHAPDQRRSGRRSNRRSDRSTDLRGSSSVLNGLYFAQRSGGGFSEDMGLEGELTIDAFHPGPTVAAAVGIGVRRRFRFELEGAYRRNEVEVIEIGPDIGEDGGAGDVRVTSLMLNALYVFAPDALIRPYFGLGAGFVRARFDTEVFGFCESFICGVERRERFINDDDRAAALQAMLGVEVALTPRLKFTADYRYINSARIVLERPSGDVFRGNYRNTSILLGLSFHPG